MCAKPEKQKSSGVVCAIDGVMTRRVQTLGANFEVPRDPTFELGDVGVVSYVSDTPSMTLQIDTNDIGSTDTLALICDKMIYNQVAKANLNAQARASKWMHYIRLASTNAVYRTITEQDMLNGYCSITATLNEGGTSAARTMWVNRAALTAFNMAYDINGNATENYTLVADNKTWFFNAYGVARCYRAVNYQLKSTGAGAGAVMSPLCGVVCTALSGAACSAIPVGSQILAIGVNGNILRNRAVVGTQGNATFSAGVQVARNGYFMATSVSFSSAGFLSTSASTTDRVWIMWATSAGRLWEASAAATGYNVGWELESTPDAIGALRRGSIKCYLYNASANSKNTYAKAGKALRLQSVGIDVALGDDKLYELGTDGFYGISKQSPVPITVNVTALDSDLEYFALLAATSNAATNIRTLNAADFSGKNALRVEVYSDKIQTASKLLKTITCTKMSVSNENWNITVGDNATEEIVFTTDNITIAGDPLGTAPKVSGGWYNAL